MTFEITFFDNETGREVNSELVNFPSKEFASRWALKYAELWDAEYETECALCWSVEIVKA